MKVYRQDVTRQNLLYNSLKLDRTVAGHFTITESWLKSNRLFNK